MNVILITADTLRADHLSCHGYWRQTSPNLDRIAAEGVRFERFIGRCAHTLPSFTSMMTGLTPFDTGVVATLHCVPDTPSGRLSDHTPTLAEMLARSGVQTVALDNLMNFACHPSWFARGFARYINPNPESFVTRLTADRMNEVLLPELERLAEPFFLWAHYWDPHLPYNQPDEFIAPFDVGDGDAHTRQTPDGRRYIPRWGTLEGLDAGSWAGGRCLDQSGDRVVGSRNMINAYDGEIRYLDARLSDLFERLHDLDLWDDTCIIFTADHGETMADHLSHFAHVEALDACTHLPFIIKPARGMKVAAPVVEDLATHTDLAPTIMELLGVEADVPIEGHSLVSLIAGEQQWPREHVLSTGMYLLDRDDLWKSIEVSSRTRRWRLRVRAPLGDDYPTHGLELSSLWSIIARLYRDEPPVELYDVAADPDELTNVAADHPDVVAELTEHLRPAFESRYWYRP